MRISYRSPFRANSKARQQHKQKLHRDVLLSSSAEQKEKERKSQRIKEYGEILFTPKKLVVFVAVLFTQLIVTGFVVWIINLSIGVFRDHLMEHLEENFNPLRRAHGGSNDGIESSYKFRDIFLSHYKNKKPVLVKSTRSHGVQREVTRLFVENYSDCSLNVGHVTPLSVGGRSTWRTMTMREYLLNDTFSINNPGYVFDSNLLRNLPLIRDILMKSANISNEPNLDLQNESVVESKDLLNNILIMGKSGSPMDVVDMSDNGEKVWSHEGLFEDFDGEYMFSVGKKNSGLAFHQHRQSYNELIHGEKHWYLYAPNSMPEEGFSPWETHIDWLKIVFPRLTSREKPIEIIQRAGEVLYIPEGWYHATVSLSALTLAISRQPKKALIDGFYDHTTSGIMAMKEELYEHAINCFSRALNVSYNADTLRKIGEAYRKLDNFTFAERLFLMSLERNHRHPASYIELIDMLMDNEDYSRAMGYLNLADRRGIKHPLLEKFRLSLLASSTNVDFLVEPRHAKLNT